MPFELDGGTEEAESPTPAPEEEAPAAEPETSEKADEGKCYNCAIFFIFFRSPIGFNFFWS